MRTLLMPLVFAAAVAACTEIVGPTPIGCQKQLACQVSGVDLVVDSIRLIVPDGQSRDAATGEPVFQPGEPLSYVVRVWNRGDVRSAEVEVNVWFAYGLSVSAVTVPALDPGETFADTLQLLAPTKLDFDSDSTWLYVHHTQRHDLEDPLLANDLNRSAAFIVALPVPRATIEIPDTLREGEPVNATITIHNVSRYGDLAPQALAFCLFDWDVGCGLGDVGSAFGLTAVPAIGAGDSWSAEIVITVSDYSPYPPFAFDLYACLADAGSTLEDFLDWQVRQCIVDGKEVYVLDGVE